jgi:hypothetical protein
MAYGTKYQLYCKGKDGVTSKVVISEDDYTGSEIDRNVPYNPFILRKDAAAVICGTSLEFLIREETDFEFLEFYTNNPKKYKIEFYWPSTTLLWTGWLNTQQYEVPYKPGPTNVRLQATDGLGLLKEEDFTLTGTNSQLAIIRHCIDKIGISLSYSIAINLWEVNHDDDYCPLAQTYEDCEKFEDMNCYEVLEALLKKFDASITQWANKWYITSYKDKKVTRLIYTSAGVYSTTEAAATVLDLGMKGESGVEVYPNGCLTLSLMAGGKRVHITSDYGLKTSVLDNYRFEQYASLMFTGWTKSGTFTVYQGLKDGTYYAVLSSYSNVDTDYIYQAKSVVNGYGQDFKFDIDVCPIGYSLFTYKFTAISMQVRIQVTLLVGSTTYYLTTSGWGTTAGYITQTITSAIFASDIVWSRISIATNDLPGNGTLTVKLMRFKSPTPGTSIHYIGVAFALPSPHFLYNSEEFEDAFDDTANFDDSTESADLEDIEVIGADVPTYENASMLYDRVMRLSTGVPTVSWRFSQSDTAYTLINALVKMLASRNLHARQQLRGTIKGSGITFQSLIKHAYNSNREFELYECEWDVFAAKFAVTLLEFIAFADQDVTFDSGTILGDAANLTVASVSCGSGFFVSDPINATVHIDNSGDSPGQQFIDWKVVDGSDVTQSSGTHLSGIIPASDDEDHVISMYAPSTAGTYYVKAKISTDSSWVSSSAITVAAAPDVTLEAIYTVADGYAGGDLTIMFAATNAGGAGLMTVFWRIRDSSHNTFDGGSGNFYFSVGDADYYYNGLYYPGSPDTDYDVELSLDGYNWITSNHFESLSP